MTVVREACPADGPLLVRFFLETPIRAGTEFVLDRSPDFAGLLRLRGHFRTFVAFAGQRVAGTVTALWHEGYVGDRALRVGELVDLRVAPWARGGPVAARLLAAALDAFRSEPTDWVLCLIGENNRDAMRLVLGKAGFPSLRQFARYASVHFPAFRLPSAGTLDGVHVRAAGPDDGQLLDDLTGGRGSRRLFSPATVLAWPDPAVQHRGWIASSPEDQPVGALVVWDAMSVRRIRVLRYSMTDHLFRAGMTLAALVGAASALPAAGGALRLWASRRFGVVGSDARAARALVRTAIHAAALAGQHIVQINLAQDDPLLHALPVLPRSVYWTRVFACPFGAPRDEGFLHGGRMCFADVALV